MKDGRRLLVVLLFLLCFGAEGAEGRTIYVRDAHKGIGDGTGSRPDQPLPTINSAFKIARPGDSIMVGAGLYTEGPLTVPVPGLRIIGQTKNEGDSVEPLVVIAALGQARRDEAVPLIADSHNTEWSGIAFDGKWGRLMELRGFTGSFTHCRFDLDEYPSSIAIYGGAPRFIASSFLSARNVAATVELLGDEKSEVTAAFCLFQDFGGAAFTLMGGQKLTAINSVFAHCGHFLIRDEGAGAPVSAVNSVFYLLSGPQIARQSLDAPKVSLENCLYTPAPDRNFHWDARRLTEQPEIECTDCLTASPRFKGGKQVFLNLGIDDARNTAVWDALAARLNEYSLPITLAVDFINMTEEAWQMAAKRADEGHEVGTHSATHSSLLANHVLRVGYYDENMSSAQMTVDRAKMLRVEVDGQEILRLPLAEFTVGGLVEQLELAGIRAQLSSTDFRDIPAHFLAETYGQNIFFPAYLTALNLDTGAYRRFSLTASRQIVEENLKRLGAKNWRCLTAISPFGEFAGDLVGTLEESGYLAARGRRNEPPDRGFEFDTGWASVNVFPVRDVSSNQLTINAPLDSDEELFRVFLDYLKHSGGAISFYSHSHEELSRDAWHTFFALLANDKAVKVLPLADIAGELAKNCQSQGGGNYSCAPGAYPNMGVATYQPQDDSPLIGTGKATPFTTNFAGREIPSGRPNIGLY